MRMDVMLPSRRTRRSNSEPTRNLKGSRVGLTKWDPVGEEKAPSPPPKLTQTPRRKRGGLTNSEGGGDQEPSMDKRTVLAVIEPEVRNGRKVEEEGNGASDETRDGQPPPRPSRRTFAQAKRAKMVDLVIISPNGEVQDDTGKDDPNDLRTAMTLRKNRTARTLFGAFPDRTTPRKSGASVDFADPRYLRPFKFGWKRELVYRSKSDDSLRPNADVYYYTPAGKKARSMREVRENLKNSKLKPDDFTFYREPLGVGDPAKEIVRFSMAVKRKLDEPTRRKRGEPRKQKQDEPLKQRQEESRNQRRDEPEKQWREVSGKRRQDEPENRRIVMLNATDRKFMKPFLYGWRREVVYRVKRGSAGRRNADVYYLAPDGDKMRSKRELGAKLKGKTLVLDDFTFQKGPVTDGRNPHVEIVRESKFAEVTAAPASLKRPVKSPSPQPSTSGLQAKFQSGGPSNGKWKKKVEDEEDDDVEEEEEDVQVAWHRPNRPGPVAAAIVIRKSPPPTVEVKAPPSVEVKASPTVEVKASPTVEVKAPPTVEVMAPPTVEVMAPPTVEVMLPSQQKSKVVVASAAIDSGFAPHSNYLGHLAGGYGALLHVFQYLKLQDLLRASCVCRMWRDAASNSSLWRTVRLKHSRVHDFEGFAVALRKRGTVELDLRKTVASRCVSDDISWPALTAAVAKVESLRAIAMSRCTAESVEQLARSVPTLEVVEVTDIKCDAMDLDAFAGVTNLRTLRLRSFGGLRLTTGLSGLRGLKRLTHLSLTFVKDLSSLNVEVIGELCGLESLDLGDCTNMTVAFAKDVLPKLGRLAALRLEQGLGTCCTSEILTAVATMRRLEQLELVNFDVLVGFDKALGACANLRKLLIMPSYVTQSSTTNHLVLEGVFRLRGTLTHFAWGITLELLRVTEMFVNQCQDDNQKQMYKSYGDGDVGGIPVLKRTPNPVLFATESQVEILPLPRLQELLLSGLPATRVKILKVPYHATWRQTMSNAMK